MERVRDEIQKSCSSGLQFPLFANELLCNRDVTENKERAGEVEQVALV